MASRSVCKWGCTIFRKRSAACKSIARLPRATTRTARPSSGAWTKWRASDFGRQALRGSSPVRSSIRFASDGLPRLLHSTISRSTKATKSFQKSTITAASISGRVNNLAEVIAAADALVVAVGDDVLHDHQGVPPIKERYDRVYLLDERGWYYRHSHLVTIDEAIKAWSSGEGGATTWHNWQRRDERRLDTSAF